MPQNVDLASLFKAVTGTLVDNKDNLNQADSYNHDHGDNMVDIFRVITEAMETQKGADPADQLAYASQLLKQRSQSGSAKLYAQGLSQASKQYKGKEVTPDNAMDLIQALLGGGQAPTQQEPAPSGDLLGSLLSGLTGQQSGTQEQAGLDVGDLVNAGMAFLNAKQQGGSNLEAIVQAVVSGSQVGQTPHRAQSGSLVANTLFQMIGSMAKR